TERKKLEQELLESYEKLEEADKLKTEFISNITHELMTPMTAIKGFTELIKDETLGSVNEEQKKSLDVIFRNSERLINLINQLLHVTYLENSLMDLHKKTVSMNDIISKAVEDVRPQTDAKRITVTESTESLPEIKGDEDKLYEVIINLLVNAVKFTPNNGRITINSEYDGDNIHISVNDTGIGIPEDKLSSIFERFYQVDGSDSRKYGGTGIGLSLCKSVIEKHNGSIYAESNEKGSTFHILLPVKKD
ncbi:MAG: HAMP domain-containing histidine kinase, partial [Spirochaetes bacterium]|nr:HAMP domain-containing histidine kinase [Spirochaetota bacterium]